MKTTPLKTLAAAALCLAVAAACGGGADKSGGAAKADAGAANTAVPDSQLDAEIERLERLAERNPGDDSMRRALAGLYVRRGHRMRAGGDLRAALRDYQSAIKFDEDNEEAINNSAEVGRQLEGDQTGEYGEPAPLPISPGVTTGGDDDNNNAPANRPASNRPRAVNR